MLQSGAFEFRLDYSKTKGLAVGDFVRSDNVSAGGRTWRVRCYPCGSREEHNGENLSFSLELVGECKNVKAIFEVLMMNRDGEPSLSDAKRCVQVYPIPKGSAEEELCVKRTNLESLYVINGRVTFICGIIILCDDTIAVPPPDIGVNLGSLLDRKDRTTDVTFTIRGHEMFHAHRAVLAARSPVFRAELCGSAVVARMLKVEIHDIEIVPAAFRVMLRFIYTDSLPEDNELGDSPVEMCKHLLVIADRYALDRLKLMCAKKLWDSVTVDTVAITLAFAEAYNCPELKNKCFDFFVAEKNFKKAASTNGYGVLMLKFPCITDELRHRVGAQGREIHRHMHRSGVQA